MNSILRHSNASRSNWVCVGEMSKEKLTSETQNLISGFLNFLKRFLVFIEEKLNNDSIYKRLLHQKLIFKLK
jgi:hypothetical protein